MACVRALSLSPSRFLSPAFSLPLSLPLFLSLNDCAFPVRNPLIIAIAPSTSFRSPLSLFLRPPFPLFAPSIPSFCALYSLFLRPLFPLFASSIPSFCVLYSLFLRPLFPLFASSIPSFCVLYSLDGVSIRAQERKRERERETKQDQGATRGGRRCDSHRLMM